METMLTMDTIRTIIKESTSQIELLERLAKLRWIERYDALGTQVSEAALRGERLGEGA